MRQKYSDNIPFQKSFNNFDNIYNIKENIVCPKQQTMPHFVLINLQKIQKIQNHHDKLPISTQISVFEVDDVDQDGQEQNPQIFLSPFIYFYLIEVFQRIFIQQLIYHNITPKLMFASNQFNNPPFYLVKPSQFPVLTHSQEYYISILANNQEILINDVSELKSLISDLKKELRETAQQMAVDQALRAQSKRNKGQNGQQIKKTFAKDQKCPQQGCRKKYSSKIALNAHLRKFHRSCKEKNDLEA